MRFQVAALLMPIILTVLPNQAITAETRSADADYIRDLREGAELLRQGNHARAIGRFKFAMKHKPESADAYYWLALAFSDLGHYSDAAEKAEKAVLADDKMADAWQLWGQCLLYRREWQAAKEKLDKAHVLDPNNPLIKFNIGRCYYHGLENMGMALHFFKKVLEIESHPRVENIEKIHAQARLYAGSCYLAKDMPLAAIASFKAVRKINPQSIEALFQLGLAYRAAGMFADAAKTLQEVVTHKPMHYEAHLQLGHIYLKDLPDPEQARLHLSRFWKYAPKDHPWRDRVYEYYSRKTNTTDAADTEDTTQKNANTGSAATTPDSNTRTPAESTPTPPDSRRRSPAWDGTSSPPDRADRRTPPPPPIPE